ncbi:zf-TFIIB domain-containing protein [bacterium]|nr:zf-TFIIB domain-containing protein [bacterium]
MNIAKGYVGEVELESHLKEIHEVSFETMHDAEKWWDEKYVKYGRPSWADMNIGQRRKTINAYLMKSPSTEMRGFLKCPKCGITFNDSENTDDELTIHLMKDHQVPEDLAEEMTTFEVGKNGLQPTDGWASFESKAKEEDPDYLNDPDYQGFTQDAFGNQVKSHPSQYTLSGWDWEEKERMNARGDVDFAFDSKANEMSVDTWWQQVTNQTGSDLARFQGTDFNQLQPQEQNHYFSIYMEELGNDKYGDHMALFPDKFTNESKANEFINIDRMQDEWNNDFLLKQMKNAVHTYDKTGRGGDDVMHIREEMERRGMPSYDDPYGESKANEDSLVKIEDNNDDDTQITLLDEWKNESNLTDESMNDFLTQEGFLDDMEKQLNKVGVNLDRDPEQVESLASESLTLCPKCGSNDTEFYKKFDGSDLEQCNNCGEIFIDGVKLPRHEPTRNDYNAPVERDHAFGWNNVFPAHDDGI